MWQIAYTTTNFVTHYQGTLPVILTCPHNGRRDPGVPERTGRTASCRNFSKAGDAHTRPIVEGLAQTLLEISGEAPSVVIAEFHRRFIDANREPRCAYEDARAQLYYDEYHAIIRALVDAVRQETGGVGLLFDIHGTNNEPEQLYLGTADGETIGGLLQFDPDAMWRRRSLRGWMRAAGYAVSPVSRGDPEVLDGGYTVRAYGSTRADGLDAIQIEIAAPLRDDPQLQMALIRDLAHAIRGLVFQWVEKR